MCQSPTQDTASRGDHLKIAVVTVTKDNPDQLVRTLSSIRRQTVSPSRHLVVDGSNSVVRESIQSLAAKCGAEYFWSPPLGIYDAMNFGLGKVDDDSFVWFVNSGDWLCSPRSIESMKDALQATEKTVWAVGDTVSISSGAARIGTRYRNREQTLLSLRLRDFWFPHPSTVTRVSAIRLFGGFDEGFAIAADYLMSLRVFKEFGEPLVLSGPLTAHQLDGVSAVPSLRGAAEGSAARVKVFGVSQLLFEPALLVMRAAWTIFVAFGKAAAPGLFNGNFGPELSKSLDHYCEKKDSPVWPKCCLEVLEN